MLLILQMKTLRSSVDELQSNAVQQPDTSNRNNIVEYESSQHTHQLLSIPLLHSAENRSSLDGDDDDVAIDSRNTVKLMSNREEAEVLGGDSQREVIGNSRVAYIDNKRLDTKLDMDAICKEETAACHLSSESNIALIETNNYSATLPAAVTVEHHQASLASISLNRKSFLIIMCQKKVTLFFYLNTHTIQGTTSVNQTRSNESTSSEYNITKKLVIISTVHILLNVPRLAAFIEFLKITFIML